MRGALPSVVAYRPAPEKSDKEGVRKLQDVPSRSSCPQHTAHLPMTLMLCGRWLVTRIWYLRWQLLTRWCVCSEQVVKLEGAAIENPEPPVMALRCERVMHETCVPAVCPGRAQDAREDVDLAPA